MLDDHTTGAAVTVLLVGGAQQHVHVVSSGNAVHVDHVVAHHVGAQQGAHVQEDVVAGVHGEGLHARECVGVGQCAGHVDVHRTACERCIGEELDSHHRTVVRERVISKRHVVVTAIDQPVDGCATAVVVLHQLALEEGVAQAQEDAIAQAIDLAGPEAEWNGCLCAFHDVDDDAAGRVSACAFGSIDIDRLGPHDGIRPVLRADHRSVLRHDGGHADRVVDDSIELDVGVARVDDLDVGRRDVGGDVERQRHRGGGVERVECDDRLAASQHVDVVDLDVHIRQVQDFNPLQRFPEGPGAARAGDGGRHEGHVARAGVGDVVDVDLVGGDGAGGDGAAAGSSTDRIVHRDVDRLSDLGKTVVAQDGELLGDQFG